MPESDQQPKQENQIVQSQPQVVAPQPRTNVSNMVPFSTVGGLMPTTFQEAWAFAGALANSTIVPELFRGQQGNCFVALEYAANLKVSPVFLMNNLMFVNNRASLWGDLMLAIVQRHPEYEWHKEYIEGDGDNRVGVFEIKRKGQELHVSRFSVQDAKIAGLWNNPKKDPWCKYQSRMLCMRPRGYALRDKFADALYGLITREEAEDLPQARNANLPRQLVEVGDSETWIALKDEVAAILKSHIKTDSSGNRWNTARIRAQVESFKSEAELEDYRDSLLEQVKQPQETVKPAAETTKETAQVKSKQEPAAVAPKSAEQKADAAKSDSGNDKPECPDCKIGQSGASVKCRKHLEESKKNANAYLKVLEEISELLGRAPEGVTTLAEFDASTPAKQLNIIELAIQYRDRLKAPKQHEQSKPIESQPTGADLFGNR